MKYWKSKMRCVAYTAGLDPVVPVKPNRAEQPCGAMPPCPPSVTQPRYRGRLMGVVNDTLRLGVRIDTTVVVTIRLWPS